MVRSFLRKALREFLEAEDEDEAPETRPAPQPMFEGAVILGPNGPIQVPPGMNPIQFIVEQMRAGRPPQVPEGNPMLQPHLQGRQFPLSTPTMRNGPTGSFFAIKEIDCAEFHPVEKDPEVQALLAAGWEPFSIRQISAVTGFQGVRVYFRKQLHS